MLVKMHILEGTVIFKHICIARAIVHCTYVMVFSKIVNSTSISHRNLDERKFSNLMLLFRPNCAIEVEFTSVSY